MLPVTRPAISTFWVSMSASTTPEPSTKRLSLSEIFPFTVPWMTRSSSPEISPSMTMLDPMTVFAMCVPTFLATR